ncbi:hypothetical protein HC928_24070 [bacterium]|nr:hypothetical protein [bacterium]
MEVRLSKLAMDTVYNPQTTRWQQSYDGRKKEPITLPVKFPLLLSQGVEGIAVGLATKILPHNFTELIKASIDILKNKKPKIYPDFLTGGIIDISEYNQGYKGGRIKVRARIEAIDKKTLMIREIPFGTTTTSIMESISDASTLTDPVISAAASLPAIKRVAVATEAYVANRSKRPACAGLILFGVC